MKDHVALGPASTAPRYVFYVENCGLS